MGAEESTIKSYHVDPPYDNHTSYVSADGQSKAEVVPYAVHPARHKVNGSKVSIFIYSKNLEPKIGPSCAETLKLVRHPCILKYIDVVETERHLKLITEDVVPLSNQIHCLETFEIISGLYNVLEALIFLHEKAKLVHGNLHQYSIFVGSQDGTWKIGCMEKAVKSSAPGINVDISCFAEVAKSLLDGSEGEEEKLFLQKLERDFADQDSLCGTELSDLIAEPIFSNGYLETIRFLNCITMKSEREKRLFFSQLAERLRNLNPTTVAKKLLPKLMSKMILGEPSAEKLFIPHLWKYNDDRFSEFKAVLPEDVYLEYCLPLILKQFRSKQTHVRLVLLKYISLFVHAIDKVVLEEEVLPLMLIGLRDSSDAIVSATFHGLASIVPILGGSVVVGGERAKYFSDSRPSIGTHELLQEKELCPNVNKSSSYVNTEKSKNRKSESLRDARRNKNSLHLQNLNSKCEEISMADSRESRDSIVTKDATSLIEAKLVTTQESMRNATLDESDAEWEGFEAVSSNSESEERFEVGRLKSTAKSTENLLVYAKDSSQTSSDSQLPYEPSIAPLGKAEKFSLTSRKNLQPNSNKPKRLGEEFEFDVAVKSEEPDFFADMVPDLAQKSTVLVDKKFTGVSAKFEAAGDQPEFGWDTDEW